MLMVGLPASILSSLHGSGKLADDQVTQRIQWKERLHPVQMAPNNFSFQPKLCMNTECVYAEKPIRKNTPPDRLRLELRLERNISFWEEIKLLVGYRDEFTKTYQWRWFLLFDNVMLSFALIWYHWFTYLDTSYWLVAVYNAWNVQPQKKGIAGSTFGWLTATHCYQWVR